MIKFKTKWKNSVFTRLIVAFFVILIPLYVFGFLFYSWGNKAIQSGTSNDISYQNKFFMSNLTGEINRIEQQNLNLINDDDVNYLASVGNEVSKIDRMFSIRRLQTRLNYVKNSSKFIQDLSVFIPSIGRKLSAANGSNYIIDDINPKEFLGLQNGFKKYGSQIYMYQNKLIVSQLYPNISLQKTRTSFIIETVISKDEIQNQIQNLNGSNSGITFLLNNENNELLASSDYSLQKTFYKLIENLPKSAESKVVVNHTNYIVVSSASDSLNLTVIKIYPEKQLFKSKYRILIWIYLVIVIATILLFSVISYRSMLRPIQVLAESFKKIEEENFDVKIEHQQDDEFKYIYARFNKMTDRLKNLIEQNLQHTILIQKAELKQLQAQINPHFLFNSFITLNSMIYMKDYDDLEKFTNQLSEYFKFITRNAEDEVSLSREVSHARSYCEIQEARFGGRIKVNFQELPKEFENILIPRLTLQPIIENAFAYGLEDKISDGILNVSFESFENEFNICVEDNGEKISEELLLSMQEALDDIDLTKEVTATINIHRRLKLKLGDKSGLRISKGEMGGLKVVIVLPM